MKFQYFILSFISLISICFISCQQERELLQKVVSAKLADLPAMQTLVNNFFPPVPNRSDYIYGNGFTKFSQSNDIMKYVEVSHDNLRAFLTYLIDALNVPQQYREAYIGKLYLTRFAKTQNLIINDLVFNVGSADCKYATIIGITNRDARSTDWLVADIKLQFSLAPDFAILRSSHSSFFGLFKDESIEYVAVPKSLTNDQITAVTTYFQIVTFQGFNDILKTSSFLQIENEENLKFLP